jgi:membrane associated rhomboid family serine protease
MMNMTPVVKQLLILNIIFFIGSNYVGDVAYQLLSLYYPESDKFQYWQPLTHMFMHADVYKPNSSSNLMHIVFNMMGLVMFGSPLEHFWGGKKFLFFYISCGLGAALIHTGVNYYQIHTVLDSLSGLKLSQADLHTLLNVDYQTVIDSSGKISEGPINLILDKAKCTQEQFNVLSGAVFNYQSTAVGASGAIYGLLTAFAFMFPNAELMLMFIPFPIKAKYFVPGLVALDSGVTGFSVFGGGIAHFAHVGGALFGFIMMMIWRNRKFKQNRWN